MFALRDVSVRHGRRAVLDHISASIPSARVTVIAGPNGAGKSTLLHVLAGRIRPWAGSVTLHGREVGAMRASELARRRAVVMQATQVSFPFTVGEIVAMGAAACPAEQLPSQALRQLDLEGFENRIYQELSGGEQQRVHLARALCQVFQPVIDGEPAFLLLDEPTSSLDIRHQHDLLRLARQFAEEGGGVVAVLHDLGLALRYADEIILIDRGRLVAHDVPARAVTRSRLARVFGLSDEIASDYCKSNPITAPARSPR